jgi:hypothetical protein
MCHSMQNEKWYRSRGIYAANRCAPTDRSDISLPMVLHVTPTLVQRNPIGTESMIADIIGLRKQQMRFSATQDAPAKHTGKPGDQGGDAPG